MYELTSPWQWLTSLDCAELGQQLLDICWNFICHRPASTMTVHQSRTPPRSASRLLDTSRIASAWLRRMIRDQHLRTKPMSGPSAPKLMKLITPDFVQGRVTKATSVMVFARTGAREQARCECDFCNFWASTSAAEDRAYWQKIGAGSVRFLRSRRGSVSRRGAGPKACLSCTFQP
jgi:hypothetical protein